MSRTHSPAKLNLAACLSVLALAFGAQKMSASVTYIVGTCTSGKQFSTIQAALDASPAPNTVEVCPGQYAEQITITKPVTLEGISAGNASLAEIALPADFTANAHIEGGSEIAAAQIYVDHVKGGAVNLTNLNVYGANYTGAGTAFFIGVVYENSSGTINQVRTSQQTNNPPAATGVLGFGIWIEGGSSQPSVTVENSSVHDFSSGGIFATGETNSPDLNVTIENNFVSSNVSPSSEETNNIVVDTGINPTVSGNTVSGASDGILIASPTGSITGNTVLGSEVGIELGADGASVTANNIYGATTYGIDVSASLKKSKVENNIIRAVKSPASTDDQGIGIELNCKDVSSSLVNSNTIMDAFVGYEDARAGFGGSNTYLGLFFNVDNGNCTSGSVSGKAKRPAGSKLLEQLREQ